MDAISIYMDHWPDANPSNVIACSAMQLECAKC